MARSNMICAAIRWDAEDPLPSLESGRRVPPGHALMCGQAHASAPFRGRSGNERYGRREVPPDFDAPGPGTDGCRMLRLTQFAILANAALCGGGPEQSQPHHHRDDGEPFVR